MPKASRLANYRRTVPLDGGAPLEIVCVQPCDCRIHITGEAALTSSRSLATARDRRPTGVQVDQRPVLPSWPAEPAQMIEWRRLVVRITLDRRRGIIVAIW